MQISDNVLAKIFGSQENCRPEECDKKQQTETFERIFTLFAINECL